MATYHLTPPIRGGERPRLPSAQLGPVTIALAAMQAAGPDRQRIRDLRRRIAERIEADIALLDALAGDPDFEDGSDLEDNGDAEPSLGSLNYAGGRHAGGYVLAHYTVDPTTGQQAWAGGVTDDREQDAGDDREDENEHGGDVQDELHDAQFDDEHAAQPIFMGGGAFHAGSFGRDA